MTDQGLDRGDDVDDASAPDDPTIPDNQGILWFPVRHHSPAAARAVIEVIDTYQPSAILIEGPSDWTNFDQLLLGHRLPIALMTWARWATESGREIVTHALYPFTEFSPEWQAIVHGSAAGARVQFIDLPWQEQFLLSEEGRHDAASLQRSDEVTGDFYERLSSYIGRHDLTAVWDEVAEIDPGIDAATYLRRAALIGAGIRAAARLSPEDRMRDHHRELHMAARIVEARKSLSGTMIVVTGAAHTSALQEMVSGRAEAAPPDSASQATVVSELGDNRGALLGEPEVGTSIIPTSFVELDQHSGYLAGQPSPGFYDAVYRARDDPRAINEVAETMLNKAITGIRKSGRRISTADAIAVRTTMQALARVRNHPRVWRDDLTESLTSVLLKDVIGTADSWDGGHPLIHQIRLLLQGDAVGQLADGTDLPHLVKDVQQGLADRDLSLARQAREVVLDLDDTAQRSRSHFLHCLQVLDIPAGTLVEDVDDLTDDSGTVRTMGRRLRSHQTWRLRDNERVWTAATVASRYGASVEQAVLARLADRSGEGSPAQRLTELTRVLSDAVRCGLSDLSGQLTQEIERAIRQADNLLDLARPLGLLVRFHRFDHWYGVVGRADFGALLVQVVERCVELIERLPALGPDADLDLLAALLRRLCDLISTGALDHENLTGSGDFRPRIASAIERQVRRGAVTSTGGHTPEAAGAFVGAQWILGLGTQANTTDIGPRGVPEPSAVGQWYAGLLAVAGHLALASPHIFDPLSESFEHWDGEEFLAALPQLRRAGEHLLPRERQALLEYLTGHTDAAPAELAVTETELAELLRHEEKLWATMATHTGGLRADVVPGSRS